VVHCPDDTSLARISEGAYYVDSSGPVVQAPTSDWFTGTDPEITLQVSDDGPGASGVDRGSLQVTIDGETVSEASATFSQVIVPTSGLGEGAHILEIRLSDHAGNESVATFDFGIDTTPPVVSDAAPQGLVEDSSPELVARVADDVSGLAIGQLSMTLQAGLIEERVAATFDEQSDTLRYQVPDSRQGLALSDGPLPPGDYLLRVTARDLAGNARTLTWSFTVPASTLIG
jgi:hypothetical protein